MELPGDVPELELRHVTKRFGDVVAVSDISLQIRRGEFFSLLGPSGCGKSTTLRMIAGFTQPTTGEVHLRGTTINGVPPYRRQTNMVFQHLALFPHMDVASNIAFGLRMKRLPRAEVERRVRDALRLVELSGFEHRRISQISGGQQQRVAIARALVNDPAVLLLDEPLGALDLKLRLQMQEELRALQERLNSTFIYVTHDQGEALMMSSRIAVMNQGIIEQVGTSEEIYSCPRTEFVATFIGDTNLLRGHYFRTGPERAAVRGEGFDVIVEPAGVPLVDGQATSVSVRFERVVLGPAAERLQTRFAGTVRDVVFLGSNIRYQVQTAAGLTLTAQAPNQGDPPHARGEVITVGWRPSDGVLVAGPLPVDDGH